MNPPETASCDVHPICEKCQKCICSRTGSVYDATPHLTEADKHHIDFFCHGQCATPPAAEWENGMFTTLGMMGLNDDQITMVLNEVRTHLAQAKLEGAMEVADAIKDVVYPSHTHHVPSCITCRASLGTPATAGKSHVEVVQSIVAKLKKECANEE